MRKEILKWVKYGTRFAFTHFNLHKDILVDTHGLTPLVFSYDFDRYLVDLARLGLKG
jgi:hypothetical protein